MMLELGDDGTVTSVNEEELVYVDKKELEELVDNYHQLEKENEQFKKKQLGLLHDEFKGYFGLLKHGAKNLSEKAIVEKIQRDINQILREVFDDD